MLLDQTTIGELRALSRGVCKIALFSYFDELLDENGEIDDMGTLRLRGMEARHL